MSKNDYYPFRPTASRSNRLSLGIGPAVLPRPSSTRILVAPTADSGPVPRPHTLHSHTLSAPLESIARQASANPSLTSYSPFSWLGRKLADRRHKNAVQASIEAIARELARPMETMNMTAITHDVEMEDVRASQASESPRDPGGMHPLFDNGSVSGAREQYPLPIGISLECRVPNEDGTVDDDCDFQTRLHDLKGYSLPRLKELGKLLNIPYSNKKRDVLRGVFIDFSGLGQTGWKERYARPNVRSHRGSKKRPSRKETQAKQQLRAKQVATTTRPGLRPDNRINDDLEAMEKAIDYGVMLAMLDPLSDDEFELNDARPESDVMDHYTHTSTQESLSGSVPVTTEAPSPGQAGQAPLMSETTEQSLDNAAPRAAEVQLTLAWHPGSAGTIALVLHGRAADHIDSGEFTCTNFEETMSMAMSLVERLGITDSRYDDIRAIILSSPRASSSTTRSSSASISSASEYPRIRGSPAAYPHVLSASPLGSMHALSASISSSRSGTTGSLYSVSAAATIGSSSTLSSTASSSRQQGNRTSQPSVSVPSSSSVTAHDAAAAAKAAAAAAKAAAKLERKFNKQRTITLYGTVVEYTFNQLPRQIPAVYFSDNVDALVKAYGPEDRYEVDYDTQLIPITLNGMKVPLRKWSTLYGGHPDYGNVRHRLDEFGLVVEEYRRFATPEAFWATHKTYTAALEESRKRRMAEVEVLAERVMTTQGSDLEAKGAHNIAKKYLTLARLGALPHPDTQLHEDIKDFYERY
ncbi:hypothetical protein EV121DRAFT_297228 [Schizophyllum commune]